MHVLQCTMLGHCTLGLAVPPPAELPSGCRHMYAAQHLVSVHKRPTPGRKANAERPDRLQPSPQHPPASGGGSGRWWSAGGPRLAAAGSRRRAESPRSRRCAGGVRSRDNTRRRSLANRTATAYADTRTARCEPMRDMVAHLSALRLASVSTVSCSAVSMVANVRLHAAQQLRRLCRPDAAGCKDDGRDAVRTRRLVRFALVFHGGRTRVLASTCACVTMVFHAFQHGFGA